MSKPSSDRSQCEPPEEALSFWALSNTVARMKPLAFDETPKAKRTTYARSLQEMSLDKLERRLLRYAGRAIGDFQLIEDGDRILVGVSGGKDSWTLLHLLKILQCRAPVSFELIAVNIDQGFANFRQDLIEDYLEGHDYKYHMVDFDTARLISEKLEVNTIPCSLCARLRRGILYSTAKELKCNKIALGHHLDDFAETLLMNTFFVGTLGSMAVKLQADDNANTVIRPLVYAPEEEIRCYAQRMAFPIICCQCPLACGKNSQRDFQRQKMKKMIQELERDNPFVRQSIIRSLSQVKPTHLLDTSLWEQ